MLLYMYICVSQKIMTLKAKLILNSRHTSRRRSFVDMFSQTNGGLAGDILPTGRI